MRRPLLVPLVPLYRAAAALHDRALGSPWRPVRVLDRPVVSIGNLSTGGTGKTPLTITLARELHVRGFAVDVLSRGYGRRGRQAARVDPAGEAAEFGDEPLLIARESGRPVYVGRARYEAGRMAEAGPDPHPPQGRPLVHLLDDGFQHRQLARDVDIVLLGREDRRDRLLPAGDLREPLRRLERAHVIAVPDGEPELEDWLGRRFPRARVWRLRRRMSPPRADGPVIGLCGIARPEQFFQGLEAGGLRLAERIALADHHRLTPGDVRRILARARASGASAVVTTAKDHVRLGALAGAFAHPPLLVATLEVEIDDAEVALEWLVERLRGRGSGVHPREKIG